MVDNSKMMFSRGINCRYCGNGYYAMQHVVDYANERGMWDIVDVQKEDCVKNTIWANIDEHNPASVFHFGHGNDCVTTGDTEKPVWVCGDCSNLAGRIIYLMSCLTANGLGPSIINDCGGKSYAGFNVSWTWMASDTTGDPYEDPYAYPFFESAMELWIALLDGKTFGEAVQQSYNKYSEWITIKQDAGDANSVKWLIHDRDSLVGLGDMSAVLCNCGQHTTVDDCLDDGCYWYNNKCNNLLPEFYEDKVDISINVPEPQVEVTDLTYPEKGKEGFGVQIDYKVTNNGGNGTIYGYIVNVTNNDIYEDSYWEEDVDYGDSLNLTYQTPPLSNDTKFRIEVYLDGST